MDSNLLQGPLLNGESSPRLANAVICEAFPPHFSFLFSLFFLHSCLFLCDFVLLCVCEYEWCGSIMYPVVTGSVVKVTSRTKGRNVLIDDA